MVRTEAVRRALTVALASAPGLGAFTAALGVLGLDGATRLCAVRRPSKEVLRVWARLGYRVEQLPSAEDIRVMVIGVAVARAMVSAKKNRPDLPVALAAKKLGVAQADALRGVRLLNAYGAKIDPLCAALGAF